MTNIRKTLLNLLNSYKNTEYCTPVDFIEDQLKEEKLSFDNDVVDQFIKLIQHEGFLKSIVKKFDSLHKHRTFNENSVEVFIFFVIFLLDETNFQNLLHPSVHHLKSLLYFLSSEEHYEFIAKSASKFFENEYVVNVIMCPLLNKAKVLKTLGKYIQEQENIKIPKLHVTKPVEFNLKKWPKEIPPPPLNTPNDKEGIPPVGRVPKTNWFPDLSIQNSLKKDHIKNLLKAKKLLDQAMKMSKHLTRPRKIETDISTEPVVIKPKKVPNTLKKEVEIKGNITTTLREAALLMKEQEDEISRIEEIIKGGYNMQKIEEIELEDRRRDNQKAMEDIQKKHLKGLITFEEAILAKKKLLELNRMKTSEMKVMKIDLAEKLDKWRQEEQEKVKAQVEKCQKSKQDMKESEKKLLEKKQTEVRIQQFETKELLKKSGEKKAKELARKMELIQEIRSLHELTMRLNESKKEFDPTETPNLGLLCEMSIAELHERLFIAKMTMQKELEERRRCIVKKKMQQQIMIQNVKDFISQTRKMSKPSSMPIFTPDLEQSADLVELRKRLEEKRNLRMKT
ncbi:hypothetical protein JTB14_034446 [Gonioctena quinquepunctata]|nr:hypothetical protein JTB14_034446 [Gonioctena quinquepunctata]